MIDSRDKRASAIACRRLPWMRRFLPAPNGSIDQGDRQQTAWTYRGILAGAAVVIDYAGGMDAARRGFGLDAKARGYGLDAAERGFGLNLGRRR